MLLGIDGWSKKFILHLQGKETYTIDLGDDARGNITRIENAIDGIVKELDSAREKLQETERQFNNAKEEVKAPFNKEEELKQLTKELDEINISLNLDEKDKEILDDEEQEEQEEKKDKDYDRDEPEL